MLTPSQMRAKRIAAMQRSITQSQASPATTPHADTPSSGSQQATTHRPESALNRLVASTPLVASGSSIAGTKSPVPMQRTVTPKTTTPKTTTTTTTTSARASPVPVVRPAAPPAVKKIPYEEWECDKIGDILGVCLSVRFHPITPTWMMLNDHPNTGTRSNTIKPHPNLPLLRRRRTTPNRPPHIPHQPRRPPHRPSLPRPIPRRKHHHIRIPDVMLDASLCCPEGIHQGFTGTRVGRGRGGEVEGGVGEGEGVGG